VTRYMLDTNICIELLRGRGRAILQRLRQFEIDEVSISSIVLAELRHGVSKSSNPARQASLLADFCAPLDILPFDVETAEEYGRIRAALERAGTPIGPLDTLIAGHAISADCTLVTNNEAEFQRVPGLAVENWSKSAS